VWPLLALSHGVDENQAQKTSFKSRGPWGVLIVLALLVAAGVGVWTQWDRIMPPPPAPAVVDAGVAVDAGVPAEKSVNIAEGDAVARDAGIIPADWLKGGDLVRRAAGAVNAVAEGATPRPMLSVLQPDGAFTVDEQAGKPIKGKLKKGQKRREASKFFISEKNDARYDKVTKMVTQMDPAAVARLYKQLKPYLEAAYREIARPGQTFDAAFGAAVDRLAAVPITDRPREVVPLETGVGYAWKDPKLEALSPAEKHLLRMGPKNARAIVKQLQAFRTAMKEP
jgi:hypothetical protein